MRFSSSIFVVLSFLLVGCAGQPAVQEGASSSTQSLTTSSMAVASSSVASLVTSSSSSSAQSSIAPVALPRLPLAQRGIAYTNTRFGFSLMLPSYLSTSPSQCEYAPFPPHGYPVKALEDGDITYITPAIYGDLPYDQVHSSYGTCKNVNVTLQTIKDDTYGKLFYYQGWKMVGQKNIANDADLLAFIRQWYGTGCGIKHQKPSGHPGTIDVEIDGVGSDSMADQSQCPLNFLYAVKYSPTKHEVITWEIGQDGRFEDMDIDMAQSFRFE